MERSQETSEDGLILLSWLSIFMLVGSPSLR